jgi:site-specific DNA-methyltransferase (adenine-specific)
MLKPTKTPLEQLIAAPRLTIDLAIREHRNAQHMAGEAKTIPYTPYPLIDEISQKIEPISTGCLTASILVLYTIEWAMYLVAKGFKNVSLTTRTFDPGMNTYCAKFGIRYITEEQASKMKFDVVVGNPPYQFDTKKNNKLYVDFIKKAFQLCNDNGFVALITPESWRTMAEVYDAFFLQQNVISLNLKECGRHFPGINIIFSYFVTQYTNTSATSTEIITEDEVVNRKLPVILGTGVDAHTAEGIYEKVLNKTPFDVFTSYTHHTDKAGKRLTVERTQDSIFNVPVLNSIKTSKKGDVYIWANRNCDKQRGVPRVIVSTWPAQYEQTLVSDTIETSQAFVQVRCNTIAEATSTQLVLKSKLYRFLVKTLCPQRSLTVGMLKKLPAVDVTRSWTDAELYEHFKLTPEEIQLIEDTIK